MDEITLKILRTNLLKKFNKAVKMFKASIIIEDKRYWKRVAMDSMDLYISILC